MRREGETYRSIQNILASLTTDIQLDIRSIATRHIGLGHEKRTPNLAIQQRRQPPRLLLFIPILGQHLHISRIRRGVVGRLGRQLALAQILGHQTVLEVTETGAQRGEVLLGQEHIPETKRAGFGLEVFEDGGGGLPSLRAGAEFGFVDSVHRDAVFLDELFDLGQLVYQSALR